MASYNIEAIKAALLNRSGNGGGDKLNFWKCTLGDHEIRFLPWSDGTGQPFLEVLHYQNLSERRLVAPSTYGLPDPIIDLYNDKRKTREGWEMVKSLRPKKCYYAVIIVRGEEPKGPQVWEFSESVRNDLLGVLTSKDYVDEDMFNPETGYDFTIKVVQAVDAGGKLRSFNGYPIKEVKPTARRKPCKLGTPADSKKWIEAMPKLDEHFRKQVKSPEELIEVLENFVATKMGGPSTEAGTDHSADMGAEDTSASEVEKQLGAAFGV